MYSERQTSANREDPELQNAASDQGLHCLPLINFTHYENTPIQIYWKFYHQKMKIFS